VAVTVGIHPSRANPHVLRMLSRVRTREKPLDTERRRHVKRPLGVWIIGILALISAILRILGGITALGVSGLAMTGTLGEEVGGIGGQALGIGIVSVIVGVLLLIFAFSFLGLRPWAWTALMIFEVLTIVVVVVTFVFDGFHWASLVGILIPLVIVIYLTRPRIRRAFSR
jgi:hypothetical protein